MLTYMDHKCRRNGIVAANNLEQIESGGQIPCLIFFLSFET